MCFSNNSRSTFSRRASPARECDLRAASHQGFTHARHQLFVLQYLVGVLHPVFPQVAHLFGDEAFAKMGCCRRASIMRVAPGSGGERDCFSCCHCFRKRSRFSLASEQPISKTRPMLVELGELPCVPAERITNGSCRLLDR
jgi:hypothetical protein